MASPSLTSRGESTCSIGSDGGCGTGTGATVAALTLRGVVSGKQTRVVNDGGVLFVDIVPDGAQIYLTGGADAVFEGEY